MILQDWWFTTLLGANAPLRQPLRSDLHADILIIGGGAAGLAAALRFLGTGLKVVLLEKNICGGSSTGKSAGFLTPDSEMELSQILRRFGVQGARDLWEVPTRGIQIMKSAVEKYGLACDFHRQDSLFLANDSGGWKEVVSESTARQSLGFSQTLYPRDALPRVIGSVQYLGGIRYPDTFGINPLQYAQGLKQVLIEGGIRIFEASEVRAISGHTARTHLGSVTAQNIILCADKLTPRISPYSRNVYHALTFLSVSEPLRPAEVAALFPDGPLQCWDSDLIYSYYRLTGDNRILLGGGSILTTYAQKDVTTTRVIDHVIRGFKKNFPFLKRLEFIQYWPGRIDTTRDLLPTVARDPSAPWIHVVLGCVGLPWASFCGDFAARHVLDDHTEDHHYYRYFRPDRPFLFPLFLESLLGKEIVFSLNNAWAEYWQVDTRPGPAPSP